MPAPAPWARTKQASLEEGVRSKAEMLLPEGKAMRSGVPLALMPAVLHKVPRSHASVRDLEFVFCRPAAAWHQCRGGARGLKLRCGEI